MYQDFLRVYRKRRKLRKSLIHSEPANQPENVRKWPSGARNRPDYWDLVDYEGEEMALAHKNLTKKEKRRLLKQDKPWMRKSRLPVPQTKRETPKVDEISLIRSVTLDSFYEFVKEFWDTVVAEKAIWNWHIDFLCKELQHMAERVFRGELKQYDLVVNIAPGTTKSMIMSVMFPAWCMARMPSFRFIGASYSFPLQMELSMKCRDVMQSDKYRACFPDTIIREDQNTKGYYKTTRGGFRYAVGVNGAVLGMHAHFIVIDDPLNPQQAMSAADINSANHWIKHTLSTRKVDKGMTPTALVMQRLHQDDPSAFFLRSKGVRHICLPAELEKDENGRVNVLPVECIDMYTDGLMDPVRMNHKVLQEEKAKGDYYYSSQFRQDPVPAGGGMFKVARLKYGQPPTRFQKQVRFWDKAGTLAGGAYTVGTKIGLDLENRLWVLDVIRVQLEAFERERLIEQTAILDGWECMVGVEQEPGSGGKESAEMTVKNLQGFRVRVVKADKSTGGKEWRADPWAAQVNAGRVYLPQDQVEADLRKDGLGMRWTGWAKEFVEELRYFPFSKYADQVDSSSGAFSLCHKRTVRVGAMDASTPYQRSNTNSLTFTGRSRTNRVSRHQQRKNYKEGMAV